MFHLTLLMSPYTPGPRDRGLAQVSGSCRHLVSEMNNRWRGLREMTNVRGNYYNWSQVSLGTRFISGSLDIPNYQFCQITMKFLTKGLNDLGKYFISYD